MRWGVGILLVGIALCATPVQASDYDTCIDESIPAERSVAACTRMIASKKLKGGELALIYMARGVRQQDIDIDRALADLNRAARLAPTIATIFEYRADAWKQKGDLDRAFADRETVIRLNPKDAVAYFNRGVLWSDRGDPDRAMADYDRAVQLAPKLAIALNNRGYIWLKKGDVDRAIEAFTQAMRANPSDPAYPIHRGNAWLDKGDIDRAMADFNESIRVEPTSYGHQVRSAAWLKKGDTLAALRDADEAVGLGPKSAEALIQRSKVLQALNRPKDAIADLRKALTLDPDKGDRSAINAALQEMGESR